MNLKLFAMVFGTVFLAELGDKTQLATILYAAKTGNPRLTVFLGSACALMLSSALGVLAGSTISQFVNARTLSWIAGLGFIVIGCWTIYRA